MKPLSNQAWESATREEGGGYLFAGRMGFSWGRESQMFPAPFPSRLHKSLVFQKTLPTCVPGPTCALADDFYNGWREVANSVSAFLSIVDMALPASICMLLQDLTKESSSCKQWDKTHIR